jgi:hypothetical protein
MEFVAGNFGAGYEAGNLLTQLQEFFVRRGDGRGLGGSLLNEFGDIGTHRQILFGGLNAGPPVNPLIHGYCDIFHNFTKSQKSV